jgi:3-oxoacyl-[acyl-carrier protein] reductase
MVKKMVNLYIVYGSETKLLTELFSFDDAFFIRIYNSAIPEKLENAVDVNSFDQFKDVFEKKFKELTPKKIIFIGAAFLTQKSLFLNETKKNIDKSLDVNILQYVQYCHFILPYMVKIKSGNFIYLSSFRAQTTARGISLYAASKAFGEKFFEVIGKENGAFGVSSTSIRMGYFDGRMTNVMAPEKIKKFTLSVGNRRLGSASDLIGAIKFILSSSYTNGGAIDLTGGISFE